MSRPCRPCSSAIPRTVSRSSSTFSSRVVGSLSLRCCRCVPSATPLPARFASTTPAPATAAPTALQNAGPKDFFFAGATCRPSGMVGSSDKGHTPRVKVSAAQPPELARDGLRAATPGSCRDAESGRLRLSRCGSERKRLPPGLNWPMVPAHGTRSPQNLRACAPSERRTRGRRSSDRQAHFRGVLACAPCAQSPACLTSTSAMRAGANRVRIGCNGGQPVTASQRVLLCRT